MKAIKTTAEVGNEYGHVPGHKYHDVCATVNRTRKGKWSVEILEVWGSAQGYDQEQGRKRVIGRGESLSEAARDGSRRAEEAGINTEYLSQSLSQAEAEAAEIEAEDENALASFSDSEIAAESHRRTMARMTRVPTPNEDAERTETK